MHKILSLAYVLIIVSYEWAFFQLYLERGSGFLTSENLFFALSFGVASGLVGYLHYKIYRTPQRPGVTVGAFFLISLLNVLLSLSVGLLYLFAYNHGDLLAYAGAMFMTVTLFLSLVLAITLLIKNRSENTQV